MELLTPEALIDIVAGYKLAAAMHALVELAIPDELASGPLTAHALSARAGVDEAALSRLLRLLCSRGALVLDGDRYRNSPLTDSLRGGESRDMFLGWQSLPAFVAAWQAVADAARSGRSPFEVAHGVGLHAYFASHPEARARYDAANASTIDGFQDVADALDLSAATTVVSIGGASGIELVPILQRWPQLRGVLADLPDALTAASSVMAEYGMTDRVTIVAGDSRESAPPGDAYVLSTVLRCLDDPDATAVLTACHAAAEPGASMHVIEMPVPDGPPQHPSATTDMTAWVAYGGGDRTIARWRELHEDAGWRDLQVTELDGPFALLSSLA